MQEPAIQEILPLVQMPSRYLGCEFNRVKKSWTKTPLHVALAFPDLYEIGTSHFGMQILYGILNAQDEILAERVFAPAGDMERQLRQKGWRLVSLESQTPINQFDMVGFSLLYELNYTNVVNMLDLGGISLAAAQRQEDEPFVIGGGPCTCNPEPIADCFDAMVVGDGEVVILQLTEAWKRWRRAGNRKRTGLLERWAKIQGVYIPSFFDVMEGGEGTPRLHPKRADHQRVERVVIPDLNQVPAPNKPVIPFGRPIHDRLRIEIARGCTRGCRFCQAGMIYRPVRERQPQAILASVGQLLLETGYEDLSLLSLSTGDYSCLEPLMRQILQMSQNDRVAVSLPSVRAGSISSELIEMMKRVRKPGFTIAPEAGSQRLRDVINKNITEADIVETVEMVFSQGWKTLKLYFMIGLPTETWDDIEAIATLVKQLTPLATGQRRGGRIHVSVATFVPKPHTPFQWESQISLDLATKKINWLKTRLNLPGVLVKWQDPRVSLIEGVWARGDRKLNPVLINAWKNGCRFDGWTDSFDYDRWLSVFVNCGVNPNHYLNGYSLGRPLPWDHIKVGVTPSYLMRERALAMNATVTTDCRHGECSACGVCDWDTLRPVVFDDQTGSFVPGDAAVVYEDVGQNNTYLITFKKIGFVRFLGHLEMVKIFIRSLRRANIPLKYSNGFHPLPKVTFGDTLPMGMESEQELMLVSLTEAIDPGVLLDRLGSEMPSGLEIVACEPRVGQKSLPKQDPIGYQIVLTNGLFERSRLEWFASQPSVIIYRKNKRAVSVSIDLKKVIQQIQVLSERLASMTLGSDQGLLVRPGQVLGPLFNLTEDQVQTAIITKRKKNHV